MKKIFLVIGVNLFAYELIVSGVDINRVNKLKIPCIKSENECIIAKGNKEKLIKIQSFLQNEFHIRTKIRKSNEKRCVN